MAISKVPDLLRFLFLWNTDNYFYFINLIKQSNIKLTYTLSKQDNAISVTASLPFSSAALSEIFIMIYNGAAPFSLVCLRIIKEL